MKSRGGIRGGGASCGWVVLVTLAAGACAPEGDAARTARAGFLESGAEAAEAGVSDADIGATVWQTVQELNRAWTVDGRPELLREYFHPTMVVIDPAKRERTEGGAETVANWTAFAREATIRSYRESDPKVQVYGGGRFAVVTYYYDMTYDMDDRDRNVRPGHDGAREGRGPLVGGCRPLLAGSRQSAVRNPMRRTRAAGVVGRSAAGGGCGRGSERHERVTPDAGRPGGGVGRPGRVLPSSVTHLDDPGSRTRRERIR